MITKEALMGDLSPLETTKARYHALQEAITKAYDAESGELRKELRDLHNETLIPWGERLNSMETEIKAGNLPKGVETTLLEQVNDALTKIEETFRTSTPKTEEPTWHPVSKPEPTTEAAPRVRGTMAPGPEQEAPTTTVRKALTAKDLMAPSK